MDEVGDEVQIGLGDANWARRLVRCFSVLVRWPRFAEEFIFREANQVTT